MQRYAYFRFGTICILESRMCNSTVEFNNYQRTSCLLWKRCVEFIYACDMPVLNAVRANTRTFAYKQHIYSI